MNTSRNNTRARRLAAMAGLSVSLLGAAASAQVSSSVVGYTGQPMDISREMQAFDFAVLNDAGHVMFLGRTAYNTPANDECAGAIEIPYGQVSIGNSYATTNNVPTFCGQFDVWYRFTAPRTEIVSVFRLCSGLTHPAHRMGLYSGTCGALTPVGSCGEGISQGIGLTAGQTYYLRVGGVNQGNSTAAQGVSTFVFSAVGASSPSRYHLPNLDNYLFINRGSGNEPILHEGDVTSFDPLLTYRGMSFASLGGGDRIALPATARTETIFNEPTGVSLAVGDAGGALAQQLRDTVPPPPAASTWRVPVPQLTTDGLTAYSTNAGDLLRVGARQVARTDPAPGLPVPITFDFLDQPVIAGRAFAFRSTLAGGPNDTNNMGIWADDNDGVNDALSLIVRLGDAAPGAGAGVTFASLPIEPAVNDLAEVAIVARLTGASVTPETDSGVWRGSASGLSLVAREGDAAPGVTGGVFSGFVARAGLNRRADLLVRAFVTGTGIDATNNAGLWLGSAGGSLQLIAREGDQAPGLSDGVLFDHFADPILGAAGDIAVVVRLRGNGVDRTNNEALYLRTRDGRMRAVVRRGDLVTLPGGGTKTVRTFAFGDGGGAGADALNFAAQVVYKVEFTDFTQAVLVSDRACPGDWDHTGTVSSTDFFAFLTDYFANAADFNRDGYVNSQDFFDFTVALFEPCE